MERADFTGAALVAANFGDTVLSGVSMAGADLTGADLSGVHLVDVDLTDAIHGESTRTAGATYDFATVGAWW